MTNHEALKTMSADEMAAIFYLMMKPLIEAFGFDDEQAVKEMMQMHIKQFLKSEVKKVNKEVKKVNEEVKS